jgi:hypothetical protein
VMRGQEKGLQQKLLVLHRIRSVYGYAGQSTHHVGAMGLDCVRADEQPGGDFGVGVACLQVGNKKGSLQATTYSPRGSPPKYHRRWRA